MSKQDVHVKSRHHAHKKIHHNYNSMVFLKGVTIRNLLWQLRDRSQNI